MINSKYQDKFLTKNKKELTNNLHAKKNEHKK